jgi:hypothetical protein
MLKIFIPKENNSQVRYVFNCLMTEFLGLKTVISVKSNITNFRVVSNGRSLDIVNTCQIYGSNRKIDTKSIDVQNGTISIGNNSFDIVSLFGVPELIEDKGTFVLNSDVVASTFFMLSRWEEHCSETVDNHGRFYAKESLAYKNKFLERPIVNEYVEMIWAILQKMGCKQKRKERTYSLMPTHDVDKPYMFNGLVRSIRYIAGSLKRGRLKELARYTNHLFAGTDPFDTYDMMMDYSERENTKSHFFFLQEGRAKADENHKIDSPKIRKLIRHIKDRGHLIGFHPSYNAYKNESLFRTEKQNIERITKVEVTTGRHHFLRWDTSTTPQIWQKNNMSWDSTLGYADHAGFRCGVCYPFPLYDLVNNRQLDVFERPLIAMEWSLIHYQGLTIDESEIYIEKLKSQVKKYNGEFVFLYHNSAFFISEYYGISDRLLNSFYKH